MKDNNYDTFKEFQEDMRESLEDIFAEFGLQKPVKSDYMLLGKILLWLKRDFNQLFPEEDITLSESDFKGLVMMYARLLGENIDSDMMRVHNLTKDSVVVTLLLVCSLVFGKFVDKEIGDTVETNDEYLLIRYAGE